jgi:hypothetical protein
MVAVIFAMFVAATFVIAYNAPQNPRTKYNFNSDWRVFVGDASGAEA